MKSKNKTVLKKEKLISPINFKGKPIYSIFSTQLQADFLAALKKQVEIEIGEELKT